MKDDAGNMKYSKILEMDINNGPGVRVSLFLQGCNNVCKGCNHIESKSFMNGKPWTLSTENELMYHCKSSFISGLSILCGDAFTQLEHNLEYNPIVKRKYPDLFNKDITINKVREIYKSIPENDIFVLNPIYHLLLEFKKSFLDKNVWLWSPYSYDDLIIDTTTNKVLAIMSEICLDYVDVLVDNYYINENEKYKDIFNTLNSRHRVLDLKHYRETGYLDAIIRR